VENLEGRIAAPVNGTVLPRVLDFTTETPYMQTIVEMPSFQRSAAQAGMSEREIVELVDYLATSPDAGDEIVGTGGCRKIRVAGRGKGKSGGYRVITFFSGSAIPVFLLLAYSKADQGDLDGDERAALKKLSKTLVDGYRAKRHLRSVR
jgi:hypothetical protein